MIYTTKEIKSNKYYPGNYRWISVDTLLYLIDNLKDLIQDSDIIIESLKSSLKDPRVK